MPAKTKRPLKKASIGNNISLPQWIVFWSLVLCTMIMIVATFTSAIQPMLNIPYNSATVVAQQ